MNKRNFKTGELDKIGRKLLDAARVRDEEIEKIVGAPTIFDAVKTRISTEQSEGKFKKQNIFLVLTRYRIEMATAAFSALFIIVAVAGILYSGRSSSSAPPQIAIQNNEIETSQPDAAAVQPLSATPDSASSPPSPQKTNKSTLIKRANYKITPEQNREPLKKENSGRRQPRRQNENKVEFYPLTFAGNLGDAGEDLRIIRADLPRSSLFALGVNLPVENENSKVKTDLLIGADGIVRAIRLVE